MGIFDKVFGNKGKTTEMELPPCPHAALMPRWDSAADMGHEELATSFACDACHAIFTPEEAQLLRDTSVTSRLVYQEAAERA